MKLKVWEDEGGLKHASLDGIEVSAICRCVDLSIGPIGEIPTVDLTLLPSCVEVEVNAKVGLIIDGNKYRLESIKKE